MGDDVDSKAEWCHAPLGKVLDTTAKKIKICAWSKSGWNRKIKERRSQSGRGQSRRHKSEATDPAMAQLHKSIQRAKDSMWNDYLKNMREPAVWGAAKFTNLWADAIMEAPTHRNGTQVIILPVTKEFVRRQSFPPNEHTQYFELPLPGQALQSITEQEVQQAPFVQSTGKAPVPDKLSVGFVCSVHKWEQTNSWS
jgi:hypothetical protein